MQQSFGHTHSVINNIYARARLRMCVFVFILLAGSTGLTFSAETKKQQPRKEAFSAEKTRAARDKEKNALNRWRLNQNLVDAAAPDTDLDLINTLKNDSNAMVRTGAAQSLGNYTQNPAVIRALAAAYENDSEKTVRGACILALGNSNSFGALKALEDASNDSDPDLRKQAAFSLKRLKSVRAGVLLKKLQKDSDEAVRLMAGAKR